MEQSGDIEDIDFESGEQVIEEMPNIRIVKSTTCTVYQQNHHTDDVDVSTIDVTSDTIIPECYKLWIMTFGCAHNFADGEYMKVLLIF